MTLIQEKVSRSVDILKEQGADMWLTFVRETSGVRDPALDLLIGANDLTWPSALILTRKGGKIAIIGNLEKEAVCGSMCLTKSSGTTLPSAERFARRSSASTRTGLLSTHRKTMSTRT